MMWLNARLLNMVAPFWSSMIAQSLGTLVGGQLCIVQGTWQRRPRHEKVLFVSIKVAY